jgi:hypothetical protein
VDLRVPTACVEEELNVSYIMIEILIDPSDNMEQVEDIHLLLEYVITTCLRGA